MVRVGLLGGLEDASPAIISDMVRSAAKKSGEASIAFMGIDPGLTQLTTVAVIRGPKRRVVLRHVLQTKPGTLEDHWVDRIYRTWWMGRRLDEYLSIINEVWPKNYIMLEGYSMASRGDAVQSMAEVKQTIYMTLMKYTDKRFSNVILIPPGTWQACLLGESNKRRDKKEKSKDRTIRYISAAWPALAKLFGKDHNQFDAYAMAALYERLVLHPDDTNAAIDRLADREPFRLAFTK